MSAHDNLARLKSAATLVGCINYPPQQQSSSHITHSQRAKAKQRKWRVLISIGLLLPALAAIIGIVAWTISIEVANSDQGGGGGLSGLQQQQQRRLQQQQFKRDEALALAAIAAARRSSARAAQSARQQADSPPRPDVEGAESDAPLVVAASTSTSSPPNQPQQQQPRATTNRRRNAQQPPPSATPAAPGAEPAGKQQQVSRRQEANSKTKSESGPQQPLVLTSREQADALNGDSGSPSTSISNLKPKTNRDNGEAEEEEAVGGDDRMISKPSSSSNEQQDSDSDESRTSSQNEAAGGEQPQSGDNAAPDAPASFGENNDEPTVARSNREMDSFADGEPGATDDDGDANNDQSPLPASEEKVETTSSSGDAADQPAELPEVSNRRASQRKQAAEVSAGKSSPAARQTQTNNHKSRWMNNVSKANKRPVQTSGGSQSPTNSDDSAGKRGGKASPAKLSAQKMNSSRYTLLVSEAQKSKSMTADQADAKPIESSPRPAVEEEPRGASQQSSKQKAPAAPAAEPLDSAADSDDLSFEAIASAISSTLNNDKQQKSDFQPIEQQKTSVDEQDDEAPVADQQRQPQLQKSRRRTTGEHVAEVIDHLVDRRKQRQQASSRQEEELLSLNPSGEQINRLSGPQIVVVAPVSSANQMKARSLTKSVESADAKLANKKSEPKQLVVKKKESPAGAQVKKSHLSSKPLGARLLGLDGQQQQAAGGPTDQTNIKYSERVEVIEDDDSSALLMMKPLTSDSSGNNNNDENEAASGEIKESSDERQPLGAESSDEAAESPASFMSNAQFHEPISSIHVSSHSAEPRLRSPRHESFSSQQLERYAPLQPQQSRPQQPTKLYSAEQLIRDHVLKSKSRNSNDNGQQQRAELNQRPPAKPHQPASQSTSTTTTTTTTSTTPSSIISTSSSPPAKQPNQPAEQQTRQQQHPQTNVEPQQQHQFASAGMQSVQVPIFTHAAPNGAGPNHRHAMQFRPKQQMHSIQHQQQQQLADMYQPMESQQVQQQVMMVDKQQQQSAVEQASALPTFADQEFNVPAHMAESIISEIQRSPSTVTGMMNGQQLVFQATGPQQQPPQFSKLNAHQPHLAGAQYNNYNSYAQQFSPHQQHQHPQEPMLSSASRQYARHQQFQQQQQQSAVPWSQQRDQMAYASDLMARLVAGRRFQGEPRPQPSLMNRESDSSSETPAQQPAKKSLISSVKSLGPRSLVQPIAQRAFKHLISSFSQQAASQQAQLEAEQSGASEDEEQPRSGAASSASSAVAPPAPAAAIVPEQQQQQPNQVISASPSVSLNSENQSPAVVDQIQPAGSSPIGSAALPPSSQLLSMNNQDQLIAETGRSMRSAPAAIQPHPQQQIQLNDQEVQESYGQMPTYHMGGGDYHHYPPASDPHDKRSKGITFHFGGGPIGGGTQLITSPMGIFKHLMIPLLPNPRVNLNGKVVFGVVLEKNTAFGPPPKKKHKFWGK